MDGNTGHVQLSQKGKRKNVNLYFTAIFGEMTQEVSKFIFNWKCISLRVIAIAGNVCALFN